MSSFHVYLHSNASLDQFPTNTGGKFSNTPQNPIMLEGDWEVGISSVICKAYNVSQLTENHENLVLRTFNIDSKNKIDNWKTYSEIKNLPGRIISTNLGGMSDDIKIEICIKHVFYQEIRDQSGTTIGYEYDDDKVSAWQRYVVYELNNTHTLYQCHTLADIVSICNKNIESIITSNKFDDPIKDIRTIFRSGATTSKPASDTVTLPPNVKYIPVVFNAKSIDLKKVPSIGPRFESNGYISNVSTAIIDYYLSISEFAIRQLGITLRIATQAKGEYNSNDNSYIFWSTDDDLTLNKINTETDLRDVFLQKYQIQNEHYFWDNISGKISVKNLDTIPNLIIRLNTALSEMQSKLVEIKDQTVKCKFEYDTINKVTTYTQPDKNRCQLHISPKILHLLGIETESEWITALKISSTHNPSIDKFCQSMWIYSNIIQPQIVGDTLAQLLCIIPVKADKDSLLVSPVFDTPIYCKLAQNYISTIDILITSSIGDAPVYFDDDEVIIGLTFRRSI